MIESAILMVAAISAAVAIILLLRAALALSFAEEAELAGNDIGF